MFGKKNKEKATTVDQDFNVAKKPKHSKKKNKKDMMSKVFDESSLNVLNEFRSNEPCVVENNDGEVLCVGLWFDVNDQNFGGFGQKSRKSSDKGQIIQSILNGNIQAYMPSDLLEQEVMVIIPTLTTLDVMTDYGILTSYTDDNGDVYDRQYPICFLNSTNEIIKVEGVSVTIPEMMELVSNTIYDDAVENMLCEKEVPGFEYVDEEEKEEEKENNEVDVNSLGDSSQDEGTINNNTDAIPPLSELDNNSTDLPENGGMSDEDLDGSVEDDNSIPPIESVEPKVAEEDRNDNAVSEETSAEDIEEEEEPVETISEGEVQQTFSRVFYPGDLDLEVTTDAFDFAFLQNNNVVFFNENRGDGWLNQYLSNMSKDANVSLARLHEQHLFMLRDEFIKYVSTHAETLYGQYGYNNPDSPYAKKKVELDDAHAQNLAGIDGQIDAVRDRVVADYDKRKAEAVERAKQDAIRSFEDKYQSKIDWDVKTKEQDYRNKVDSEYRLQCESVNTHRREAAQAEFEGGINTVLEHLSIKYASMVEDENKLYHELNSQITAFMNSHCSDEIEHDKLLAKQLEESTKIDEISKLKQDELNAQAESYNIQAERLRQEAKDANKRAKKTVKEAKDECEKRISDIQYDKDKLQRQLDELLEKYSLLEDRKDKEYMSRLDMLRDQNNDWESRYNNLEITHRRANWVTVSLIAVSVVAALSVGMLVGTNMGINNSGGKTNEQTVEEVQKKLDEVEKKYEEKEKELEEKTKSTTSNSSSSTSNGSSSTSNGSTTNTTTNSDKTALTPQNITE